jgi:uncharacterized SAM-binding protein YcdF (DUF218 family)
MKKNKKIIVVFISVLISAFIYAHVHFYYNTFYKPAKLFSEAIKAKPIDVIIVPGIPSDAGNWNFVMKWRVSWSVFLYKAGITKNIIYSGGAVYTPYTEAIIMALYAEKMGVPKDHIFTEIMAEHTTENLYYSYQLALKKGFTKIGLATDPFQSLKAEPYLKKFNLNIFLIPSVVDIMQTLNIGEYKIDSYKAYQLNFVSILKRETEEERNFYSKGGRINLLRIPRANYQSSPKGAGKK